MTVVLFCGASPPPELWIIAFEPSDALATATREPGKTKSARHVEAVICKDMMIGSAAYMSASTLVRASDKAILSTWRSRVLCAEPTVAHAIGDALDAGQPQPLSPSTVVSPTFNMDPCTTNSSAMVQNTVSMITAKSSGYIASAWLELNLRAGRRFGSFGFPRERKFRLAASVSAAFGELLEFRLPVPQGQSENSEPGPPSAQIPLA